MLSYSRYLVLNLIRKKSIYLLMAFYLFINILMVAIRSVEQNKGGESFIKTIDMYTMFFPFLLSTCFSLLIIIYNFKLTEKDGSDLLICSKPIRRISMFSAKFLILILSMILFQIFAFMALLIAACFDKEANSEQIVTFASSMSVGGFVVQMIIASILVISAAFLNITSIISVGLLFSAVIPVASTVISTISEAKPTRFWSPETAITDLRALEVDENNLENEYQENKNLSDSIDREYSYNAEIGPASSVSHFYDWQRRNWYRKFAPFDIWYQWSGIMNMFRPERTNNMGTDIQDWYTARGLLSLPDAYSMEVEFEISGQTVKHKFALFSSMWWLKYGDQNNVRSDELGNTIPSIVRDYKALEQKGYITYDNSRKTVPTAPITENQKRLLAKIKDFNTEANFVDRYEKLNYPGMNILGHYRFFYYIFQKMKEHTKNNQVFSVYTETVPGKSEWVDYKRPSDMTRNPQSTLMRIDKPVALYVSEPYIDRKMIYEVWLITLGILMLISALVYTRKEFK